ncbi:MAG: catechol 2,3-dioxygenase [Rhodobacterales bacterium]|nr:MAG: catechol 2,3-dioxygenase [Rhodobacterales bacterium]
MAQTGLLRPGLAQIRVLDMEAALKHYVDHVGLHLVSKEADGRVYLKGYDEFDRHSLVLREAEEAGIDFFAFKSLDEDSLQAYRQRVIDYGLEVDEVPAGDMPGIGKRYGFTIATGHRIEIYTEAALSDNGPMTRNPEIWREAPTGMKATRLDHCLLYGPNIPEVQKFFTTALDFSVPETVESPDGVIATWMTVSNKAHDIAFVDHPEPGKLHHIAFFLETWEDVLHAADIMGRYEISLDIGPTRHGITRGQTIYFFDPSGNRNEVFCGGYTYYPDNPQRVWDVDNLGKGIFYHNRALNDRFLSVVT